MGNYVCRSNRDDTVDSIEPLPSALAGSSSANGQNAAKKTLDKCGNKRSSIERIPYRVEHLMEMSKVELEEQIKHGWNPNDKSVNIFVKGDNLTLHRRPISQSTDSIRGKIGYRKGIHMWEIKWISNQRGTHACVGVATKRAPIRKAGYCSLIGNNEFSWGWDLGRNILKHSEQQLAPACLQGDQENHNKLSYPPMDDTDTSYIVPSVFQCVLDMDAGTLGFMADGQWLGTAFSGLGGLTLYPVVSCVWGHCEVTMRYLNGLGPWPLTLKEQARRSIRAAIPKSFDSPFCNFRDFPLPPSLKRYILTHGLKHYIRHQDYFNKCLEQKTETDEELTNNDEGMSFDDWRRIADESSVETIDPDDFL